jgi:hypothetical protein
LKGTTAEFKAHEATITLKGDGLQVVYDLIPERHQDHLDVFMEMNTDLLDAPPDGEPDHGFQRYVPGDHHITITLKGRPKP